MAKSKDLALQGNALPAHLQEPPAWLVKLLKAVDGSASPVDQNAASPVKQNPRHLVQRAIACAQISGIKFAEGGYYLLVARELEGGGKRWLQQIAADPTINVSVSTLERQIRLFNRLDEVGEEDAIRRIATLSYSIIDGPLRSLGADGLRRLAHGEEVSGLTWDEVCSTSRRELERHMKERLLAESERVREAEQKADALARRLDKTNAELERYRQQEIQLGKLPPSVRHARVEGGGMAMTFNEMFSHLTELANDVFQGSDLHADHRKRQQQLTLAIDSLAIVARGAAAQAALLLQHLEDKAPGVISDSEEALPIMDRPEALAAYHRFRSMLANADYSLDTALLNGAKRKRK